MAKDHFVPRHYLRQFSISTSREKLVAAQIDPYRFYGVKGIGAVCQETDFEGGDEKLGALLHMSENDLAPVLDQVVKKQDFTASELVALKRLAVSLHMRTRKAAESHKLFPKRICCEFINHQIERGKLPAPPGGKMTEEMVDFEGMTSFLMQNVIPCGLEMQTLECKFLKAPDQAFFLTSDNPVVILNQFCSAKGSHSEFAGFSKAGFQLLLPVSPNLCLIFYDAKIYKIGSPRRRLIDIPKSDVELVNAVQIQSAENFVYFHEPKLEKDVQRLINLFSKWRVPIQEGLRTFPGQRQGEEIHQFSQLSAKLPRQWEFCRLRREIKSRIGDRRDPKWSAVIDELMEDFGQNPNEDDRFQRMGKILADPNSLKRIRIR